MKAQKTLSVALLALMLTITGCDADAEEDAPKTTAAKATVTGTFPAFTSVDTNGNKVTNEIFAQKKITVVNIWGTFCPPCISEMPDLGEWAKNMPEGAQIVGLVCDVNGAGDRETIDAANAIMKKADATFVNIVPNAEIAKYLDSVEAVPTTIFVDSQGNIVGKPIVGTDVDGYKYFVKEYLK